MTYSYLPAEEHIRRHVRKASCDIVKLLAPCPRHSDAGRIRMRLSQGYVTREMLDELLALEPHNVDLEALRHSISEARAALDHWQSTVVISSYTITN